MMEITELVMLRYYVELMLLKLGVYVAGKTYRIKICVGKGNAVSVGGNSDEADVKVRIVRDEKSVSRKLEEFLYRFPLLYLSCHHIVGDRRQLGDLLGNGHLGVNEEVELLEHLALFNFYCAYFYNFAVTVGKTRRLYIEHDHLVVKRWIFATEHASGSIVYIISLHTVEYLEAVILARLLSLLEREHYLGECLHVAVVGNGYSAVSPSYSSIYYLLRRDERIHLRHIGVQMQLNSLLLCSIESIGSADLLNSARLDLRLVIELIAPHFTTHSDIKTGLHVLEPRHLLSVVDRDELYVAAARAVGYTDSIAEFVTAANFLRADLEYSAEVYRVRRASLNLGERSGLVYIEILAVKQL